MIVLSVQECTNLVKEYKHAMSRFKATQDEKHLDSADRAHDQLVRYADVSWYQDL